MYERLAGMTGTASTSAEEFGKVYDLQVVTIPTNREIKRIDHNDVVYQTENAKWNAIVEKVKELSEKGQPVLIGTTSIEKNERMSKYFDRAGIKYEMLNAKNHEREGEIISQAGKKSGSVVIATNMAGRGVDIKLGGAPTTKEEADKIRNSRVDYSLSVQSVTRRAASTTNFVVVLVVKGTKGPLNFSFL
jgi:preprotein translocase subunit SecA